MRRFEELSRAHNRAGFDCGDDQLNTFLRNFAHQNLKKGLSRTFVLVDNRKPAEILGFYTLSLLEIQAAKLPEEFAKKYRGKIPAVKIARLGVAKGIQNQGIGRSLMIDAILRAVRISRNAGIIGLFVDAKNAVVKEFYIKYGFIPLKDRELELFLPLETLLQIRSTIVGP
jgi:GNAT superfamily N-acetyltransferase